MLVYPWDDGDGSLACGGAAVVLLCAQPGTPPPPPRGTEWAGSSAGNGSCCGSGHSQCRNDLLSVTLPPSLSHLRLGRQSRSKLRSSEESDRPSTAAAAALVLLALTANA